MGVGDYYSQRTSGDGQVEECQHADVGTHTHSEATSEGARIRMWGRSPRNEEGVPGVCARLAEAINVLTGESWHPDNAPPDGPERGVDWYLRSADGGAWGVQVTRVGKPSRWATVGRGEQVSEDVSSAGIVAEIWDAIRKKLNYRGGILALDVGQPGMHGFRLAVEQFRGQYGGRLQASVRFSEVWLVGYSAETTFRVHPDTAFD